MGRFACYFALLLLAVAGVARSADNASDYATHLLLVRMIDAGSGLGLLDSDREAFLADSGLSHDDWHTVIRSAQAAASELFERDREAVRIRRDSSEIASTELARLEELRGLALDEMTARWRSELGTEAYLLLDDFLKTEIQPKTGRQMAKCPGSEQPTEVYTFLTTLTANETGIVQAVAIIDGPYPAPNLLVAEATLRSPSGRTATARSGTKPSVHYGLASAMLPLWNEAGQYSGSARFAYTCPGAPPIFFPE